MDVADLSNNCTSGEQSALIVNLMDDLSSFVKHPIVRPLRYLAYAVTPNETSFEKVEEVPDYVSETIPHFVFLLGLEYLICLLRGKRKLKMNDGISSVSAGLLSQLSRVILRGIELTAYIWLYEKYHLIDLPWDSPWTWLLGFIGVEFGYYWFHRMAHECSLLWGSHQTHHSSEYYNLTTALRQSATQKYVSWTFYLPLSLLVPPSVFVVHAQFNLLYQFWIHTEVIKKLGPLEYILNTPSHHRVHHGRNKYCLDKNYGGTLIVFDRIFGTFQEETEEEVIYGLVHPSNTWDMVEIQIAHYKYVWNMFWSVEGWKNKLCALFMGPGWAPGQPRFGDPDEIPEIEYPVKVYNKDLPLWATVYVFVHFTISVIGYLALLGLQKSVGPIPLLAGVLYIVLTLTSFGWLFEHRSFAPVVELVRCFVYLIVDIFMDKSGIITHYFSNREYMLLTMRFIFVLSTMVWLVHCRRAQKKKTE